jgi:hypothetical protein
MESTEVTDGHKNQPSQPHGKVKPALHGARRTFCPVAGTFNYTV